MPVFTMGETLAELDAMVREHRYVAVGGLVGGGLRVGRESIGPLTRRLGMLQRRALDAGGGIHALGVGSCQILHAARTYSADTSTAESVTNYGNVLFYDGRGLRQVHACTPRDPRWRDTLRWRDHILAHGIDLAAVARHGRIPARSKRALMIGFVTGYACADEMLRRHDVLPPTGGPPGTILYIAPASSGSAHYALDADERLHNGTRRAGVAALRAGARVPAWRRGRGGRVNTAAHAAVGAAAGVAPDAALAVFGWRRAWLPGNASAGAGAPVPALPRRAAGPGPGRVVLTPDRGPVVHPPRPGRDHRGRGVAQAHRRTEATVIDFHGVRLRHSAAVGGRANEAEKRTWPRACSHPGIGWWSPGPGWAGSPRASRNGSGRKASWAWGTATPGRPGAANVEMDGVPLTVLWGALNTTGHPARFAPDPDNWALSHVCDHGPVMVPGGPCPS